MRRNVALCFALLFTTLPFLHAVPIADTVDVKIDEWLTPSNPPYPHDPAVAPDGSIWYTGQKANVVGRFDPKTEKFKEFALPTPGSGPHGVIADKDGNIWYTGNAAALIGRIDPKTEKITEYKMPDPKARDPHTMAFNKAGLMYFTVQAGNFVGTLDPKSGKIALYTAPTANARPYGIMLNSKEVPFFDEFNAPNIGSIDPKTLKITEYPLPDKGARPRRIAIAKDDTVYYSDYARGFLGRLDPKSGKVEEFESPGGPESNVSVIAPGVSGGTIAPLDLSTERNTMLPGASNCGGWSLSVRRATYAFMKSIQIGSAATAPCSRLPSDFFSSLPTHTPTVISGSNPTNQASVFSSTVPVFPAIGQSIVAAAAAVPRCSTPRRRFVITNAVSVRITSDGAARLSWS